MQHICLNSMKTDFTPMLLNQLFVSSPVKFYQQLLGLLARRVLEECDIEFGIYLAGFFHLDC